MSNNLDLVVKTLTTALAAKALNRAEVTLRIWACKGSGPIRPVKIGNRLAWKVDDINRLIEGDAK